MGYLGGEAYHLLPVRRQRSLSAHYITTKVTRRSGRCQLQTTCHRRGCATVSPLLHPPQPRYLAYKAALANPAMSTSIHNTPTPTSRDGDVVALVRAGVDPAVIFSTLWPLSSPYPYATFLDVVRALEIEEATKQPPEELSPDLENVVADLQEARQQIMTQLRSGGDVDAQGDFNPAVHMTLVKNAEALLKFQSARQDRQVHLLNLRVAQERARIELRALYAEAVRN